MRQRIGQSISAAGRGLRGTLARLGAATANLRRRLLLRRLPDYVVITLDQPLTERAPVEPWWYHYIPARRSALSLEELERMLQRIAHDPAVTGVVFLVKETAVTLTQAQSLHAMLARFRDRAEVACGVPKHVVVYLESVSAATYVFACAADRIIVPPLASWDVTGLQVAPVYLKETLARVGVHVDVVKIAPWKTAADTLSRAAMSDEERAQFNWLLDSLYRDLVDAIAVGRELAPDVVQALIDSAPMAAASAVTAGLVDALGYEDELPALLPKYTDPESAAAKDTAGSSAMPTLKPYREVRKLLLRKASVRGPRAVGVITLEGSIVTGESRQFPVPLPLAGDSTIGSTTAQQLIRAAADDDSLAAVVVCVDSGGGSALASDLIWRELTQLDARKPVVVYMGNTAASGGYYIAAPGRHIVAQSATLTGSIGVIVAKPVLAGALQKVDANPERIRRGANAGIYGAVHDWTDAQRETIVAEVLHVYAVFKERVADGRNLPLDTLDAICNGRVWTGAQAHALGLVDEIGDFHAAYTCACAAADLPTDGTVATVPVTAPRSALPATVLDAAATLFTHKPTQFADLAATLPGGALARAVQREHVWLLDECTWRVEA